MFEYTVLISTYIMLFHKPKVIAWSMILVGVTPRSVTANTETEYKVFGTKLSTVILFKVELTSWLMLHPLISRVRHTLYTDTAANVYEVHVIVTLVVDSTVTLSRMTTGIVPT